MFQNLINYRNFKLCNPIKAEFHKSHEQEEGGKDFFIGSQAKGVSGMMKGEG